MLFVDSGTGAMKLLLAGRIGGKLSFQELAIYKGDTMGGARLLAAGDRAQLDGLMAEMAKGLDKIVQQADGLPGGTAAALAPATVLGATAWFRGSEGEERQQATAYLDAIAAAYDALCVARGLATRLQIEHVSGVAEALHEKTAVEYACKMSRGEDGAPLGAPHAILGAGSGSMQVTGRDASASVACRLADGEQLLGGGGAPGEWHELVVQRCQGSEALQALDGVPAQLKARGERLRAVCMCAARRLRAARAPTRARACRLGPAADRSPR